MNQIVISTDINKLLGNEIRKRRESKGMSQRKFARECKISFAYYGRIERGEHSASISTIQLIAEFLEIRIADLFADLP